MSEGNSRARLSLPTAGTGSDGSLQPGLTVQDRSSPSQGGPAAPSMSAESEGATTGAAAAEMNALAPAPASVADAAPPASGAADPAASSGVWGRSAVVTADQLGFEEFRRCCQIPDGQTNRRLVAVSGAGRRVHSRERTWDISIVDVDAGRVVAALRGHLAIPTRMSLLPCGTKLLSGSLDGAIKLWDLSGIYRDLRHAPPSPSPTPIIASCERTVTRGAVEIVDWVRLHSLSGDEGLFVAAVCF